MNQITLYTSRSDIEEDQRCKLRRMIAHELPVLRPNGNYPIEGTYGLTNIKPPIDASIGNFFHEGMRFILQTAIDLAASTDSGWSDPEAMVKTLRADETLKAAIAAGHKEFFEIWGAYIRTQLLGEMTHDIIEGIALGEALIRAYVWAPEGLLKLLNEYEIIEVEKELSFVLFEDDELKIIFNSRPDGILKNRSTGMHYALSFKTAKEMNDWQKDQGKYDNQGLSEMLSAQKAYPHLSIAGVYMTYALKCRKEEVELEDGSKQWHYKSPLIRPYCSPGISSEMNTYRPSYYYDKGNGKQGRLTADYKRCAIWEDGHPGIANWIETLYYEETEILNKQIYTPTAPFYRDPDHLKRWERQTRARELGIHATRSKLLWLLSQPNSTGETLKREIDGMFFQDRTACTQPFHCQYLKFCQEGGLDLYLDRMMTAEELGLKAREANHPEYASE